jgi:hypothetical protein
MEGLLAAKCRRYLPAWDTTCGGVSFMSVGMSTYWKATSSPARLREKSHGSQRTFEPEEEKAFLKLLKEEEDQGIVEKVPDNWPYYTSPVHIVPKKKKEE